MRPTMPPTLRPTLGRPAPVDRAPPWVVGLDVLAKVVLLLTVARIAIDPAWGNLEGKAPGARAISYPLLALLLPLGYAVLRPARPYPWVADLLVTIPAFSDILGNRLDLYDRVVWFDDVIHLANTGALAAAAVLLAGVGRAPVLRRLEVAVASGMTFALAWELWEYVAFVTRSREVATAYADTVGDLALGWAGAVVAAFLVGLAAPEDGSRRPTPRDVRPWRAPAGLGDGGGDGHVPSRTRRTPWTRPPAAPSSSE